MNYYDENKNTEYKDDFYVSEKKEINLENNTEELVPENKENKRKFNKKIFIIVGILLFILIVGIIIFLYFPKNNDQTLENIIIDNNTYSPTFSQDIYDYYLLTEDEEIEIKCEGIKNAEGCNEKINLQNYSNYIHEIIINEDNLIKTYKLYIKVKESATEKNISINSITVSNNQWTNQNQTITINTESENNLINYSIDNGLTWQESNQFEIEDNNNLKIIVEDEYGNQSATRQLTIDNIDKISPTGIIVKEKSSQDNIVLKVIAKDEQSGIESYSWNGKEYTKEPTLTVTTKGTYYVNIKDKAGNISESISIEIKDSDFNTKKQYSATFYTNGSTSISNNFSSCTANNNQCTITLPTIERDGAEIIGWSSNKNSETADYQPGEKIVLEKDITLYAITKKEITADFVKNGSDSISSTKETCTLFNDDKYCSITTPDIIYSSGKIIGWNTNERAKTILEGTTKNIKLYDNTTYYALVYRELVVYFQKNGADSISSTKQTCRIEQSSSTCYVTTPTITRENSNIIGWSTNKNDQTSDILPDTEIEAINDTTYYAITEKKVTITFNANGADNISSQNATCNFYNDEKNCQITTPTITRNSSNIFGWSTNQNSKDGEVGQNTTLKVNKNTTYYAITQKEVTAYFETNGANSISSSQETCSFYNNANGCSITTPNISRTSWQVIGWNTNQNATSANAKSNTKITINNDIKYYAITSRQVTVTINLNTADSLGNCTTTTATGCIETCQIYNTNENCQINLPYIYSQGNEVQFYSNGTAPDTNVGYSPAIEINVFDDVTLNAIVYNRYRKSTYSIVKSKIYGYTAFETESGCPTTVYNNFYSFIDKLYQKTPYLFTAAKVTFTSDNSFLETWGNYSGMTYGRAIGYRSVDVKCPTTYSDYYLHTIVHELVHAWDSFYQAKYGTALSKMSDIETLYNKYANSSNRPLREYSYSSINEFIADVYAWYYFLYIDTSIQPNVIKNNTYFPNDMKKTIEKYINIAKSGY